MPKKITRKAPPKKTASKALPKNATPKALLKKLNDVAAKHGWDGFAALVKPVPQAAQGGGGGCPPGTSPHEYTYTDENGNLVTVTHCVPDTLD